MTLKLSTLIEIKYVKLLNLLFFVYFGHQLHRNFRIYLRFAFGVIKKLASIDPVSLAVFDGSISVGWIFVWLKALVGV